MLSWLFPWSRLLQVPLAVLSFITIVKSFPQPLYTSAAETPALYTSWKSFLKAIILCVLSTRESLGKSLPLMYTEFETCFHVIIKVTLPHVIHVLHTIHYFMSSQWQTHEKDSTGVILNMETGWISMSWPKFQVQRLTSQNNNSLFLTHKECTWKEKLVVKSCIKLNTKVCFLERKNCAKENELKQILEASFQTVEARNPSTTEDGRTVWLGCGSKDHRKESWKGGADKRERSWIEFESCI